MYIVSILRFNIRDNKRLVVLSMLHNLILKLNQQSLQFLDFNEITRLKVMPEILREK